MTAARTPAQRGAWSRNKGAKAERNLVAYLRQVGFGGAERAVRTGYRTTTRTSADPGDLTGTPGIVWSIKDVAEAEARKPSVLAGWFVELDAMEGTDVVRLLVHKRSGCVDPGRWWCWMRLRTLLALDGHERLSTPYEVPVRMDLGDVVLFLHAAGYGDQAEVAS